ncbi:MAG: hypothetical protein G8237_11445 [Magnetococcales bacterium]|nr:hypothetical protein [Magnetococcales bacterium]
MAVIGWGVVGLLMLMSSVLTAEAKASGEDWTPYPRLRKEVKGRSLVRIIPVGTTASTVLLYPSSFGRDPTVTPVTLPVTAEGAAVMVHNGIGNYHWIAVTEEQEERALTLATVHHFGMPGPAPSVMLAQPKSRLEIIPEPLPREFSTYRAQERWVFRVRLDQRDLPHHPVTLLAPHHPKQNLSTDPDGRVQVTLPEFPQAALQQPAPGARPRRPVQPFQLAVEAHVGPHHLITVFQHEYAPPPMTNRHPLLGWGVTGLGMVAGLQLWRGRKEQQS